MRAKGNLPPRTWGRSPTSREKLHLQGGIGAERHCKIVVVVVVVVVAMVVVVVVVVVAVVVAAALAIL